jgi:hypothetical protein
MLVFLRMTEDRLAVMGPWFVTVTAVNESDHQVRIVRMTLSQDDRPLHHTHLENTPQSIAPRDAWDGPIDVKSLRILSKMREEAPATRDRGLVGLDLDRPVVAEVVIATGERFRSDKTLLMSLNVPEAPDWLGAPWDPTPASE